MNRIIILANGELPDLEVARALLRADDFILCADGGTRHAQALGLQPQLIIGDMDSTSTTVLQAFHDAGVTIERYSRDKNETDLELAIHRAIMHNPKEIVIVAALGGRMDQTLANITLLCDVRLVPFNIRLDDGVEEIFFVQKQAQIEGRSGDVVSLIPWGEPVNGVYTHGLKWSLDHETLHPSKTRGISNEMLADTAQVEISSGLLLVIHRR